VLKDTLDKVGSQQLLGPVLKKRRGMSSSVGATTAQFRISASDEEVRSLRAALEQQEVATSLRQADSSFLPAQFEEKDNLLAEVAKLLEAVEEQQGELEAENIRLRREVAELRAAPYRK
jgi:septal ring factor EnvC (AmiA/AmiB activator)